MKHKDGDVAWAFWANNFGCSSKAPIKIIYNGSFWVHKSGDYIVNSLGFTDDGWICFADKDKKEVAKFVRGFMACRYIIGQFLESK